ncbi:MAG: hypothetical protein LC797_01620 [Chloroflexi bacterium]|nr:hypothetical protein [Chloroflexota bacterium]
MFQFLIGVAFGAGGYWAWQSFGRDLLGMSGDQETSYGGFSSGTSGSSYGSSNTGAGSSPPTDPTKSSSGGIA